MPYDYTLAELEASDEFLQSSPEIQRAISREYIRENGPDQVFQQYKEAVADPEYQALPPEQRDLFRKSFTDFYGVELPTEDVSFGTDVKDVVMSGLAGTSAIPKAAATVAGWFGAEGSKERLLDVAKTTEDFYKSKISEQGREVEKQPFLSDEDGQWFGDNAIKKVFMVSSESLPLMIATAPIGGAASAGLSKARFLPDFIRALEGGSKTGKWAHNLLSFGASEAGTSALVSAADAGERIAAMPEAEIQKSPVYQELLNQGMDPAAARAELRGIVEEETVKTQFAATLAGSAVAPGGAAAKLFQKGGRAGLVRETVETIGTEGAQEAGQSGLEQFGENVTTRRNLDPLQSLTENVGEAAALGAASGGLTGGAMGGGTKLMTLGQAQQIAADVPLDADPEQIAAQIETATTPDTAPRITLGELTPDELEGIAAVQARYSNADQAEIDRVRQDVLPLLAERNPLVAPYVEQIINERQRVLSAQMEQRLPGIEQDMAATGTQVATDDLMDDWADTAEDVQVQDDTRGRRQRFEQLKQRMVDRVMAADELEANRTGRPSTAEESAGVFAKIDRLDELEQKGRDLQLTWEEIQEYRQLRRDLGDTSVVKDAEARAARQEDVSVLEEADAADARAELEANRTGRPSTAREAADTVVTEEPTEAMVRASARAARQEDLEAAFTNDSTDDLMNQWSDDAVTDQQREDTKVRNRRYALPPGQGFEMLTPEESARRLGRKFGIEPSQIKLLPNGQGFEIVSGKRPQETGVVRRQNRTPFKSEADLRAAAKKRGIDLEGYTVRPYQGGFIAVPKPQGATDEKAAEAGQEKNTPEIGKDGDRNTPAQSEQDDRTQVPEVVTTPPVTVKTFEQAQKDDIYTTKIGNETRFAIRGDNPRGGGDELFPTYEEAEKFLEQRKKRDAANEEFRAKQRAIEEKEEADRIAAEDLDGFDADMSPMRRGKVLSALSKRVSYQGELISKRDLIRDRVNAGYTVNEDGDLEAPDGSFLGADVLTKTGIDYARHLISRRSIAADQPVNTDPTPAQASAGNYQKAHVKLDGLDISIENPVGSTRRGQDTTGRNWEQTVTADYGYIRGTRGKDKDHLDVFIKPGYTGGATDVFVVNQYRADGTFDEHKTVVGPATEQEALDLYRSNYEPGWTGGRSVTRVPMETFRKWAAGPGPASGPLVRRGTYEADGLEDIEGRITAAEKSGIALSDQDKTAIRAAHQEYVDLSRKASRLSVADPMNKGNAFPMGVGYTKMTKRKEQAIDSSVRKAGEAVTTFNKATSKRKLIESLLVGKGTETDRAAEKTKKEQNQVTIARKILGLKKGDKFGGATVERVSLDKDGYPASITISGEGIVDNKIDIVRNFYGRDKEGYRRIVDSLRPAPAPDNTDLLARDTVAGTTYKYRVAQVPADQRPASHLKYHIEIAREDSDNWEHDVMGYFPNRKDAAARFVQKYRGDISKVEAIDLDLKRLIEEDTAEKQKEREKKQAEADKRAAEERKRLDLRNRFEMAILNLPGKFRKQEYVRQMMGDGKKTKTESATAMVFGSLGYEKMGKGYNIVHPKTGFAVAALDSVADARSYILAADKLGVRFDTQEEAKPFIDTLRNLDKAFNRESTPDEDLVKQLEAATTPAPATVPAPPAPDDFVRNNLKKGYYVKRYPEKTAGRDVGWQSVTAVTKDGVLIEQYRAVAPFDHISHIRTGYRSDSPVIFRDGKPVTPGPDGGGGGLDATLDAAAYHGSPHTFNRFSTEKIGTGEGAQAYGHGLYFAGAREVAEYYKNVLGGTAKIITVNGGKTRKIDTKKAITKIADKFGEENAVEVEEMLRMVATGETTIEETKKHAFYMATQSEYGRAVYALFRDAVGLEQSGKLYKVELAPAEDEYLLWDRPLSEQSEKVKAALGRGNREKEISDFAAKQGIPVEEADEFLSQTTVLESDQSGRDFYQKLSKSFAKPIDESGMKGWTSVQPIENDRAASEYLHSLGIRGIKYLDGTSRSSGAGAYNYVIFNDADVTITDILESPTTRREFLARSGALIAWAATGGDITALADTVPFDQAIRQPNQTVRGGLKHIRDNSQSPRFRAMAEDLLGLLPDNTSLTISNARMNVAGTATTNRAARSVGVTLYGDGQNEATLLHEAWHAAVLARYDMLNYTLANPDKLGTNDALKQYHAVWREFGEEVKRSHRYGDMPVWLSVPAENPDEFLTYALTNQDTREWMAKHDYRGKTLMQRFREAIRSMFRGLFRRSPTWLEAADMTMTDLVEAMKKDPANFETAARVLELVGRAGADNVDRFSTVQSLKSHTDKRKYLKELIIRKLKKNESVRHDIDQVISEMSDKDLTDTIAEYDSLPDGPPRENSGKSESEKKSKTISSLAERANIKIEDAEYELETKYGIAVRDDGIIEVYSLGKKERKIIGDLPIVVYHHTSTGVAENIIKQGLRKGDRNVNLNAPDATPLGVYVTLRHSGADVKGYLDRAKAVHGGDPLTVEIRTHVNNLRQDTDDADIQSGGYQYVLGSVDIKDILNIDEIKETSDDTLSAVLYAQSATSTQPDAVDRFLTAHPALPDQWERFIYNVIDKDDPRRRVLSRAQVVNLSENLSENTDILTIERLRGKKTAEEYKRFWEDDAVPMFRDLARAKLATEDLDEYAHAKHAPERNLRMQQVNAMRFIDQVSEHLNSAERDRLQNDLIDIRSNVLMAGGTRADRQNEYLRILGDLFAGIAQQRADLAAEEQRRITNRQFTPAEIAKGTPANIRAELDARSRHLDQIERIRDRWETESSRFAGITDAEAAAIVTRWQADPRFAALQQAHAKLLEFGQRKLDILRESGQLSDVEYQSLVDGYEFYVPLHRDIETDDRPATGRVTGPTGSPIKVAKGSMLEVVHITAHSIRNVQTAINRKHKADAGRVLVNFARENPDAGITVGEQVKNPTHDSEGNIVMYNPPREADNELYVRVDGKRYTLTFDTKNPTTKRFLQSIKDADAGLSGPMQTLSKLNRILSMVNTSLAPEFIFTNFTRDIQTAGIHMEDTEASGMQARVLKNVFPAIAGIFRAEGGNAGTYWGRVYRDYAANGGKIGWMQTYDGIRDLAREIESTMDLHRDGHVVKKALHPIMKFIERSNTAVENGVRLATYDQLIRSGVTPDRAALVCSDLTVDFTRRGAYSPTLNALYLFFNAGVQGNVRMIKAVSRSKHVQAIVGGIITAGAALQMLAYAVGGEDDSGEPFIDGIPEYIRERNMIFMIPDSGGKYVKIPMPYGYNLFFNTGSEIARGIHSLMTGRKYEAGKAAMRLVITAANTFNPLQAATVAQALSPTVIDPFVQVGENKNWAGTDLMPRESPYGPTKADAYRFWKTTSAPAKWISQKLHEITGGGRGEYDNNAKIDISPEVLELMYETFTGSAGRFVKDSVVTPIQAFTSDEPVDPTKVPFVRRAYGEWSPRAISERYYDRVDEVERFRKDFLAADAATRKKLSTDPLYKMVSYTQDTEKKLDNLRDAKRKAEAAGRPTKVIDDRIIQIQTEYMKRGDK